jgi:hypothetical protein
MNLMMEPACRTVLKDADGVLGLVDVMARHGGSDWQLAGMAAKTLWNFSGDLSSGGAPEATAESCFGAEAVDSLAATLTDLLDEGLVDHDDFDVWEAEFIPAAAALLRVIEAKRGGDSLNARFEMLAATDDDTEDDHAMAEDL